MVVYAFNPTPNHNNPTAGTWTKELFISSVLHQTTTTLWIMFESHGCLYLQSYTKPQLILFYCVDVAVVYIFNPTPNHNCAIIHCSLSLLFISSILHQTTTLAYLKTSIILLFISSILHQTTTAVDKSLSTGRLFISSILHQTTTSCHVLQLFVCCLYLQSYTKPQLLCSIFAMVFVVYIFNPTPNHNQDVWLVPLSQGCLYLQSYTKPQLLYLHSCNRLVVYIFNPTPNHNLGICYSIYVWLFISSILHQTTTITRFPRTDSTLFISSILHQTTTLVPSNEFLVCCLYLQSYTKPQRLHLL